MLLFGCALVAGLWTHRDVEIGRAWSIGGILLGLAAGFVNWYGLQQGWENTHHWVGFVTVPGLFIGAVCYLIGGFRRRRAASYLPPSQR